MVHQCVVSYIIQGGEVLRKDPDVGLVPEMALTRQLVAAGSIIYENDTL